MNTLAIQFFELASKMEALRDKYRTLPPGRHQHCTVYRVKRTKVRAHFRKSYLAVRIAR